MNNTTLDKREAKLATARYWLVNLKLVGMTMDQSVMTRSELRGLLADFDEVGSSEDYESVTFIPLFAHIYEQWKGGE